MSISILNKQAINLQFGLPKPWLLKQINDRLPNNLDLPQGKVSKLAIADIKLWSEPSFHGTLHFELPLLGFTRIECPVDFSISLKFSTKGLVTRVNVKAVAKEGTTLSIFNALRLPMKNRAQKSIDARIPYLNTRLQQELNRQIESQLRKATDSLLKTIPHHWQVNLGLKDFQVYSSEQSADGIAFQLFGDLAYQNGISFFKQAQLLPNETPVVNWSFQLPKGKLDEVLSKGLVGREFNFSNQNFKVSEVECQPKDGSLGMKLHFEQEANGYFDMQLTVITGNESTGFEIDITALEWKSVSPLKKGLLMLFKKWIKGKINDQLIFNEARIKSEIDTAIDERLSDLLRPSDLILLQHDYRLTFNQFEMLESGFYGKGEIQGKFHFKVEQEGLK